MVTVPRDESIDEPGLHWDDITAFRDRALLDDTDDVLRDRSRSGEDLAHESDYISSDTPAAIYLRDISRVKLLNAEQEVEFAMAIEQGRQAHEQLTASACEDE